MFSGLKRKNHHDSDRGPAGLRVVNMDGAMDRFETLPASDEPPKILIVDDDPLNVKLVQSLLKPHHYDISAVSNGQEALEAVAENDFDLILLDIMMPVMNGYECCRRLKSCEETRLIPVVMLTALDDLRSKVTGIESGADDFVTKPPNRIELIARVKSLVKLKRLNSNLTSIENVLFSLANAVEAKDAYMRGHVDRVSGLAVSLGKRMELSSRELEALRIGGALHDIGKIAIPNKILQKPGALDADERRIIEDHTIAGYRICQPLEKNLGLALSVIRNHHEKEDGSGYPDRLKTDEIPLVTKIMSVVDYYDALITDRPYRCAMTKTEAFEVLAQEVKLGKFDSGIVSELKGLVLEKSLQCKAEHKSPAVEKIN